MVYMFLAIPERHRRKPNIFTICCGLVTFCSSTDSGWIEDEAKFGKCQSMRRLARNGAVKRKGAFHFPSVVDVPIEMHEIRNGVLMGNVNRALQ